MDTKIIEEEMKKVADEPDPKKRFAKFMESVSGLSTNPEYEKLMSNMKVACPVKKVNYVMENPDVISGCWMIIDDNSVEKIKEKADLRDLNDYTFLFFTNQHIIELGGIVYGILSLLKTSGELTQENVMIGTWKYMGFLKELPTYKDYKDFIDYVALSNTFGLKKNSRLDKLYHKVADILLYLPFISYNDIDEFAQSAINNFKKDLEIKGKLEELTKDEINESTGTTDNANS